MQSPNHTSFANARKITDKRLAAIATYEAACEAPEFVDWRTIADMLRSVVPTPKPKTDPAATWVDDPMPRSIKGKLQVPKPILLVRFTDGRSARATALTVAGKPVNWGRGVRQAIEFYRGQVVKFCGGLAGTRDRGRHVDVPEIESVTLIGSGQEFDAAEANKMTAELRAGSFNLQRTLRHAHMAGYQTEAEFAEHVAVMYLWGTESYRDAEGTSSPSGLSFQKLAEKTVRGLNLIRGRFMRSTSLFTVDYPVKLYAPANCA